MAHNRFTIDWLGSGPSRLPIFPVNDIAASPHSKKRIFIVDSQPIFRYGVVQLIHSQPDLEICGEADAAPQALDALRHCAADAVVLDIALPGANGIELTKQIRAEHPHMRILIVSAQDERLFALRALKAGAGGYLMKRESCETFLDAVRRVVANKTYVSPAFSEQLIYRIAEGSGHPETSPLERLSDRELEVLQLVGNGRSSIQIASALNLSIKTVESHRLHLKEKLGMKTSGDLVRFAVDWVTQEMN